MESSLKINTTPEYIKSADVYALSAYHTYTVCLNNMVRLQLHAVSVYKERSYKEQRWNFGKI